MRGAGSTPTSLLLDTDAHVLDVSLKRSLEPSEHEGMEGICAAARSK